MLETKKNIYISLSDFMKQALDLTIFLTLSPSLSVATPLLSLNTWMRKIKVTFGKVNNVITKL